MYRLYVQQLCQAGDRVLLTPSQAHYVRHVLRCLSGEKLYVFNESSGEWEGVLELHAKKTAVLFLTHQTRPPEISWIPVSLYMPLLKAHRFDIIVEKATEMGVDFFIPCLTQHTVVRHLNPQRLKLQMIEAAEQSHRLTLPVIQSLEKLESHLAARPDKHPVFWCDLDPNLPLCSVAIESVFSAIPFASLGLLVGPEGGWSAPERAFLKAQPNLYGVQLGHTVLRAETAAVVALAFIKEWIFKKTAGFKRA